MITSLSTDLKSDTPNPLQLNVIKRASTTITLAAQSVGVAGSVSITLGQFKANSNYPDVVVYLDQTSGVPIYTKAPFTSIDTSGNVTTNIKYDVSYDNPTGSLVLDIYAYSKTASANTVWTLYYTVYTASIAPTANDAATIAAWNYN